MLKTAIEYSKYVVFVEVLLNNAKNCNIVRDVKNCQFILNIQFQYQHTLKIRTLSFFNILLLNNAKQIGVYFPCPYLTIHALNTVKLLNIDKSKVILVSPNTCKHP